jgi:GntR family transcriptional repressor for pyruvate dehydrogenase complex
MENPDGVLWSDIFDSVGSGRSSDNIASQIQRVIFEGRLHIGQRLPNERDLGQIFGVSRSTVREAIRQLEAGGLVEVRRGITGGTFVAEPKVGRLGVILAALMRFQQVSQADFVEFRLGFEPESARLAAQRRTDAQAEELVALAEVIGKDANSSAPWEQFVEDDIAFHEMVATASGNPIRVAVMLAVHQAFRQSSLSISRYDRSEWRQQQYHGLRGIAEAIRLRQSGLAYRRMRRHLLLNVSVMHEMLASSFENATRTPSQLSEGK